MDVLSMGIGRCDKLHAPGCTHRPAREHLEQRTRRQSGMRAKPRNENTSGHERVSRMQGSSRFNTQCDARKLILTATYDLRASGDRPVEWNAHQLPATRFAHGFHDKIVFSG